MATQPGFKPLPPQTTTTSPTTSTARFSASETTIEDLEASGGDSDAAGNAGGTPGLGSRSTSSSRASTDPAVDLAAEEGYRKLLAEMAQQLVGLTSMVVRAVRARRRPLPAGVWIADRDDRKAIGAPLARIAARHAPMTGRGSDDLVDGFTAGVAGVAYALKGFETEADALDAELVDGQAFADVDDETPPPTLLGDVLGQGGSLPPHLQGGLG